MIEDVTRRFRDELEQAAKVNLVSIEKLESELGFDNRHHLGIGNAEAADGVSVVGGGLHREIRGVPDSDNALGRDGQDAGECFAKSLDMNPRQPVVLHDYGVLVGQFARDYAVAKEYIEEALSLASAFPDAWKSLAIIEKKLGNTGRAVELFKMVIREFGWNHDNDPSVKDAERRWLAENGVI